MSSGTPAPSRKPVTAADLRGTSRLVVEAVEAVTNIVEDMHRNIARVSPVVGTVPAGRTRGITGLVYRSVRGVTRAVGFGLDTALAQLDPLLRGRAAMPRREAVQAALNGVLGDYLVASGNSLAIPMQLRQQGQPLVLQGQTGGKLLVLVHGLCMIDLQWQREGHDHGAALAHALGYVPVYLHYNTGLPIAANGQDFAGVLEALLAQWPVPVTELAILGHSMGGLVTRSAICAGRKAGHAWPRRLKKLVFLGTPHQGAPLERAGSWVDLLLGVSPYTAPLARLGMVRSAGIKDLRHGRFLAADAGPVDKDAPGAKGAPALPRGVKCYVVAASRQADAGSPGQKLQGDGLVPVASALGQHKDAAMALTVPAARQRVFFGLNHFDLLSSAEVCHQLEHWLR